MMASSFDMMLLSRPFKFIVGTNEVEIVVHEDAIASQSAALTSLMRGEMAERRAGLATWNDVDGAIFVRFAQFAYTGDYSVPEMILKKRAPERKENDVVMAKQASENDDDSVFDTWGTTSIKKAKKKGKSFFDDLEFSELVTPSPATKPTFVPFAALSYPLLQHRSQFAQTCEPTASKDLSSFEQNLTEMLLCHTSLYILAEKWGVESLKRLTLFKLHQTLTMLTLDTTKVPHIVELVRHGYSGTPDLEDQLDELRELICQYVAANAEIMSGHETFAALIEEGGAFVRDLWRRVLPRLG